MRLDHLLSKEDEELNHEVPKRVNLKDCSILKVFKEEHGGLAQLGEHLLCKQGVKGSIPLISTNPQG